MRATFLFVAAALALAAPATARADKVIEAQTVWRFDASTYSIDQGEKVTFKNNDSASPGPHDVTSQTEGLFKSETIANGQEAPVAGAERLKTGDYDFYCSVHPFMTATLKVSDKGTPVGSEPPAAQPQPQPAPSDTTKPKVRVSLEKRSLRSRRMVAKVSVDERANLNLLLTARINGRTRSLGGGKATYTKVGQTVRYAITLTASARRALRNVRRLSVTVVAGATDTAGNGVTVRSRRVLRR
jgi:plastocyanin